MEVLLFAETGGKHRKPPKYRLAGKVIDRSENQLLKGGKVGIGGRFCALKGFVGKPLGTFSTKKVGSFR